MDDNEDLRAIYAAAHAIQGAAAKAVAELAQLVADNRAIPGQIAQQTNRATQEIPQELRKSADQALQRIEQGAEAAIRKAAVSDVGAKIEQAMAGPMATIGAALQKLQQSANTADFAAERWKMFTKTFRWQQLAIAVLVGIVLGSAGTWYFASQPLRAAADYILSLQQFENDKAARAAAPSKTPPATQRKRTHPRQQPNSQQPKAAPPTGTTNPPSQ